MTENLAMVLILFGAIAFVVWTVLVYNLGCARGQLSVYEQAKER